MGSIIKKDKYDTDRGLSEKMNYSEKIEDDLDNESNVLCSFPSSVPAPTLT